jgi:prephenate dehydrogenase
VTTASPAPTVGAEEPPEVGIIGSGLIGVSVALALGRAGQSAWLTDADPAILAVGLRRSLASRWPEAGRHPSPRLVLVCVPPASTGAVLAEASRLNPHSTISDVASVKTQPLAEAERLGADMSRLVGGHPLAGRESSGPLGARADLFDGRPWALCPGTAAPERVQELAALVDRLGAQPVQLAPEAHDAAVAMLSHLPQLVASALAALADEIPPEHRQLAGPGFADMTRLAASPAALWAQIAAANAPALAVGTERLVEAMALVLADLRAGRGGAVGALLERGGRSKAHFREKSALGPAVERVSVVVPDRPGALLELLTAAGEVNVEDIRIDHAPHQPTGVVELTVALGRGERLIALLAAADWTAVRTSGPVDI